jgi:hypothetical protein
MNQTENSLAFHHDGQLVAASPLHYLAVPEQVFLVPLIPIEGIYRVHETHFLAGNNRTMWKGISPQLSEHLYKAGS